VSLPFPKAVIFDWDNTLVDGWSAIAAAINQTRVQFGLSAWSMDDIKIHCTRAARESFPEWFGSRWKEAYNYYYSNVGLVRSQRIGPTNGAGELLQWLKLQKIPFFIVSNLRGDLLRIEVEKMKWLDLFAGIAGAQDAPRDKPAKDHADYALDLGGMKADKSVWFVGDSEVDIQCARNSGCTPVLIGEPEMAQMLGVELFFPDCKALQTLLYNRYQQ